MAETEGEAKVDEGQVETTEPEVTDAVAQVDTASLQSELEETRKALENAKQEAKAHQRNDSKKDAEVQNQKRVQDALSSRMDLLTEMIADVMDAKNESSEFEGQTQQRRSEPYRQKMADAKKVETDTFTKSQEATVKSYASEIISLTTSKQMELDKSPELRQAYIKWLEGDHEGAVEEVRSVVTEVKKEDKPKEPTQEEQFEKWYEARRKKEGIESGELDAETGQPKAGNLGDEDFLSKFADGSLPMTKENIERAQKINSA